MQVYVLQVLGWGDDENAMYNTGVYTSRDKAEAARARLIAGWETEGGDADDVYTDIEVYTLDA